MNNQDIEKLNEIVINDAMDESGEIVAEIEGRRIAFLERKEEQSKRNYELKLHQLKAKKINDSNKEVSEIVYENKRKLIAHRYDMEKQIFEDVKVFLNDFVTSKDYAKFIENHIKIELQDISSNEGIILIRSEDEKVIKSVLKKLKLDYKVEVSKNIKIGGFIVRFDDINILIDCSIDTLFEKQKQQFKNISALSIS